MNTLVSRDSVDGNTKAAPTPIEVVTAGQGYFTIVNGLQPGKHYQLVARTRNGERVLAGDPVCARAGGASDGGERRARMRDRSGGGSTAHGAGVVVRVGDQ